MSLFTKVNDIFLHPYFKNKQGLPFEKPYKNLTSLLFCTSTKIPWMISPVISEWVNSL